MPADYSFVVWSTYEPVDIKITSAGHGASESFPQYKMSSSVQIYDLQGNLVDHDGSHFSGGGGSSGGGSGGGGGGGSGGGSEFDPRKCTSCIDLPYIHASSEVDFNEKFQFDDGANWVTNWVEAVSETEFVQNTSIVIDGDRYFFTTDYSFDG